MPSLKQLLKKISWWPRKPLGILCWKVLLAPIIQLAIHWWSWYWFWRSGLSQLEQLHPGKLKNSRGRGTFCAVDCRSPSGHCQDHDQLSQCNLFSTTQLRDQLLTGLRERGVSLQWWLLWQWWWWLWLWWWWWWWWWWQHPEGSCRWMWGGRHQVETGACLPGTLSSSSSSSSPSSSSPSSSPSSSSSRSDHHYHPHHPRNLYHHLDVNIILPSNQGFTCDWRILYRVATPTSSWRSWKTHWKLFELLSTEHSR